MKYFAFTFIFFSGLAGFSQSKNPAPNFTPYRAYIDSVEEDQQITVFKEKGMNWKSCKRQVVDPVTQKLKCLDAVGWPSRDAKITVLGPPEKEWTVDPFSGEQVEETYVKVEFDYFRLGEDDVIHHQKGQGYIELYNLSRSARNPFFGAQSAPRPRASAVCEPTKTDAMSGLKNILKSLNPLGQSVQKLDVTKAAVEINKVAGFCPLVPPTRYPQNLNKKSSYDQLILPGLKAAKVPLIAKEDGKPMSQDDLINIDSVARTLYGEMGRCFRYGLQYPMGVAKVIVNRNNSPRFYRTFVQPPHEVGKPMMSKVATTASQFSMWQKSNVVIDKKTNKMVKAPNGPLHQGLCPPREKGKPFYRSSQATQYENDIWTNAMRIATEAVLYPKQFSKRTDDVSDMHYTSDLAKLKNTENLPHGARFINKMRQVHPVIEGRTIDRDKCLEIWKGQ